MKFCVLIIFLLAPWISRVGDWALRWTEGDEALQVIFVMLVFPVIMNATQYYIIDSFIKNQKPEHDLIPDEEDDDESGSDAYEGEIAMTDEEISSDDEDEEVAAKTGDEGKAVVRENVKSGSGRGSPRQLGLRTGNKDYDPLYDGESSPTVVGSASGSERERLVNTEVEGRLGPE